eukprot:SAG31_NODE_2867_length_4979_cov_2.330123_3_plen_125_part_00
MARIPGTAPGLVWWKLTTLYYLAVQLAGSKHPYIINRIVAMHEAHRSMRKHRRARGVLARYATQRTYTVCYGNTQTPYKFTRAGPSLRIIRTSSSLNLVNLNLVFQPGSSWLNLNLVATREQGR